LVVDAVEDIGTWTAATMVHSRRQKQPIEVLRVFSGSPVWGAWA
jgi:hypothetical protein